MLKKNIDILAIHFEHFYLLSISQTLSQNCQSEMSKKRSRNFAGAKF